MPPTNPTVYGATWCSDCKRAKKFLGEQRVHYDWVDVEQDADGLALVERVNNGKRIIPTIVFADETTLIEPSNAELAAKLGTEAYMVDDASELQEQWFEGKSRVGLTAGASAPEILVRQVIDRIQALGAVSVRKMQGIEETIKFPLPKGLKLDAQGQQLEVSDSQLHHLS